MKHRMIGFSLGAVLCMAGSGATAPISASGPPRDGNILSGLDLRITLEPRSSGIGSYVCGSATRAAVEPGQWVDICYTVTNRSGRTLDWQTLSSSLPGARISLDPTFGPEFLARQEPLGPGESWQAFGSRTQFFDAAQTVPIHATWVAQNALPPDYSLEDAVPYQPIDLARSPTARELTIGQPNGRANLRMPFAFNFYGIPSSRLCVANAGAILVNQGGCKLAYSIYGSGGLAGVVSQLVMAPALVCENCFIEGSGGVFYDTQGTAPNRRFIVEWRGKRYYNRPDLPMTFQAIIAEGSGAITFQYVSIAGHDTQYSVGMQFDSSRFTAYRPTPADRSAIRWTPGKQPYTATATSVAQVEVLGPSIVFAPDPLRASAAAGASATTTLTIGNLGNRALNWSLGEKPANTGFRLSRPYRPLPRPAQSRQPAAPARLAMPADPRPFASSAQVSKRPASPPTRGATSAAGSTAAAAVPAYAIAFGGTFNNGLGRYVALDARAPQTLRYVTITGISIDPVQTGGFIGNDFAQQYLTMNAGCNDDACWDYQFNPVATGETPAAGPRGYGDYLAPTVPGTQWRGMKWDATTNTLFALASSGGYPPPGSPRTARSDLYTIDPKTGAPTMVAKLDAVGPDGTAMLDIAIAPNGAMYGIDKYTDTLYAIDKRSGHVHPIGPTGLGTEAYDLQSMDFDQSTGALYFAAFPRVTDGYLSSLYTVDLGTGQATQVGTIDTGNVALMGFAIAIPGGPCVNPQDVPWMSFNTTSGSTPARDSDEVAVNFDSRGLNPGTYRAKLCINNDTPFKNTVTVPVEFTVRAVKK